MQRRARQQLLTGRFVGRVFGPEDGARRHRVDAHVRGEFAGERSGQRYQPGLAGCIHRMVRQSALGINISDINDSTPGSCQQWGARLGQKEGGFQVDAD